jgi:hypothetical protein
MRPIRCLFLIAALPPLSLEGTIVNEAAVANFPDREGA